MTLYPWQEVIDRAQGVIAKGGTIFQQWLCEPCGAKQTMPDPNLFYRSGICEECQGTTNIERNGHNYMVAFGAGLSTGLGDDDEEKP